jgi:hypothetical protein
MTKGGLHHFPDQRLAPRSALNPILGMRTYSDCRQDFRIAFSLLSLSPTIIGRFRTMKIRTVTFVAVCALLTTLAFTIMAVAQRVPGGASDSGLWQIWTYVPENNYATPLPLPVSLVRGGGVAFDFYPTPDRAMLLIDDLNLIKQFHGGNLTGKILSADIAIAATPGATFNYFNNDGTGSLQGGSADPGGFVRLYFNKVNTPGCPSGWHPELPECEAQYWWSNPIYIELADLAALGRKGATLEVSLDPALWSDRDGHMGTDTTSTTVNHIAAFNAAVKNIKKLGLSFGGNGWWAFGCGVNDPGQATFVLYKFQAK